MYCKYRGKGGNNNCFCIKIVYRSFYFKFLFYKIYFNDWVKLNIVYEKRKVIFINIVKSFFKIKKNYVMCV